MPVAALIRPEGTLNPGWAILFIGAFAVWMWVSWRRKRGGRGSLAILGVPPPAAPTGPDAFRAKLAEAFQQNAPVIQAALTADNKKTVLEAWREALALHAKAYAEQKAHHPRWEAIMQTEVDVYMRAYLCGVLAAKGKLSESDAKQSAYLLGRELRDRIRALEFPVEGMGGNFGVAIDRVLGEIVTLGMKS